MKTTLYLLATLAILVGVVLMQRDRIGTLREKNNTLNTNLETLTEGVRMYKTRDSLHAAGVGLLEMRLSEYRKLRAEDARLIESLKIRLRRVESVSAHATESNYRIVAAVRDTVFVDSARYFSYRSPWIDLHGTLERDSVELALTAYDTLVQVVHRVPRRFLFVRYGTRAIRQEIVSRNPHTEVVYSEVVRLKK
jgi:hypothetical protein